MIVLPGLSILEGGMKAAEEPSPLSFLFRPPGGAGSVARMPARLLLLPSPTAGSNLPGDRVQSLEDESSTGVLLVTLKSESWTQRETETDRWTHKETEK